jgi:hypothetical protein
MGETHSPYLCTRYCCRGRDTAGDSTGTPAVRYASEFPGADIGAQINAAYADLPATGEEIVLSEGGSFSIPVVFNTADKPVLLVGR